MEQAIQKRAIFKAFLLVSFVLSAVALVHLTSLKDYLAVESLQGALDVEGYWAPLLFVTAYALGICLFVPAIFLTGAGAAIFGPYWGFVYVWLGAMAGASGAFFIARFLGRDFIASIIGSKLKKYDDGIERNGFATVLYLRLVYFPFTPMSFGMGLTKVRFWDYFLGTALGIAVGTFVLTLLIGSLKSIWVSGEWGGLLSLRVLSSFALFGLSFLIPKALKKIRGDS